jgi:hypothetical protein
MEDAMDNHGTRDKLDDDETTSLKADIEQPPVNSSSEEDSPPEPLPVWEIAKLSATFCVVWFLANWSTTSRIHEGPKFFADVFLLPKAIMVA